jgi:hypothetical protein
MQPGGAGQRDIDPFCEIVGGLDRRDGNRSAVAWLGQARDDVQRISGGGQAVHGLRVIEHIGEVGEQFDVFVRAGGDGHHQIHRFALMPLHAVGKLADRDTGPQDQVAIPGQSVRDGNPVAQIGVGHLFAQQHAVDVTRLHVAGIDQEVAGDADRLGLVLCPGVQENVPLGQLDHHCIPCVALLRRCRGCGLGWWSEAHLAPSRSVTTAPRK